MDCEFALTTVHSRRGSKMLNALAKAYGADVSHRYQGNKEWLFLWGAGGEEQQEIMKRHRRYGGQVVLLDIGYFQRKEDACRVSFNGFHCPQYLLPCTANRNSNRFPKLGIKMENLADPSGHILLCGNGKKSAAYYKQEPTEWELATLENLKARFPTTEIRFRAKPKGSVELLGTTSSTEAGIREALLGASFCVVRHSNVAVDCLVYGIPCQTEGGILHGNAGGRAELLEAVSWFNWLPEEAHDMLQWIKANQETIKGVK